MVNWPDDLVKDIAKRKTVIFFGAGVSCNSKNKHGKSPKDWGDLLQHMSNSIQTVSVKAEVQDLIRSYDYLAACEIIKRVIPIRTYEKLLREEYATPGYSHAAIHENIGRLGARYVITPNIDRIYETYIQSQINSSIRIKTLRDMDLVDCIRDGDDMIIKLHGSINEPQHLVFTAKEYSEARVAHKRTYEAVYALAVTHSFLFIGCGMNDPDIRLLLEDLNFTHRSTRPHYFMSPAKIAKKEKSKSFADSMNLEFIGFDPKNKFIEVTKSLGDLVSLVTAERGEIAKSQSW